GLHESRSFGHDAASLDPVPENDREGAFALGAGFPAQNGSNILAGEIEVQDLVSKPFRLAAKNGVPDGSDVRIAFHQNHMLGEPFKTGSQADDATASERLDQDAGSVLLVRKPGA